MRPTARISRRMLTLGLPAVVLSPTVLCAERNGGSSGDGLSRSAESIHEEKYVKGSPRDVYEALTDAKKFDQLTRLSDAISLVTAAGAKATAISSEVGGTFTLFGGYITGRHLEMVPGERLVQAWRAGGWSVGEYSVAKFVLVAQDAGCKIIFDHRGFPQGQGANLAYGWRVHYWEPLEKLLAS